MKAVIVVELDLPDDEPDALQVAGIAIGRPPHAVQMHMAIREDADRVLDVFDT